MAGQYRSVNFDLDTKEMKKTLGSSTKGYGMLRKSFKEFGFSHRQGSGYRSDKPMTRTDTINFVDDFGKANPWLADCVKTFDITNSGRADYDFTNALRSAARSAQSENVDGSSSVSRPSLADMVRSMPTSSAASNNADYYETNGGATSVKLNDFTSALLDDMENG